MIQNTKYKIPYTILCTGSSGLVASDFKNLSQKKDIPFHGIDLNGEGESVDITNYDQLYNHIKKLFPSREGQTDLPTGEEDQGVLFHFAAITFTGHNLSDKQKDLCQKVNVEGTQNITQVCHELKIPLVHISTDFVFSGGSKTTPYLPSDSLAPDDTIYSQTKAESEKIVLASPNTYVIRIAFPYGNFSHPKKGLARKMIDWMENNEEVNLYSDQKTNPTPISLISQSCLKTAQLISKNKIKDHAILHVVGKPSTPFEFGKTIKEVFEKKTKLNPTKTPDAVSKNSVLDTEKTEEILGIKAKEHEEELRKI